MRIEFYSGAVSIDISNSLQISVRLWPDPSVRFWHRPHYQRWRNVYGSHGYVVPMANGWTRDVPFVRFMTTGKDPPGTPFEYYRGPVWTFVYSCAECGTAVRLDRGKYFCPDHRTVLSRVHATGKMRRKIT